MECSAGPGHCEQEASCRVREPWQRINQAVRGALARVTLAELASPRGALLGQSRRRARPAPRRGAACPNATDLEKLANREYQYGFITDIEQENDPAGPLRGHGAADLREEERARVAARVAPQGATGASSRCSRRRREPTWAKVDYPKIDYQDMYYYSAPRSSARSSTSLDEVDPELLRTYEKLGIPLHEQKRLAGVAVDAVFDSVSVATTYKAELEKHGIIFCSFSEAVQKHPELVRKYLGSVVPYSDNFFATLNSAVFSDGSFAYIPKGVRCPMELSTYFRINAQETGQFERTLIVADEGAYVSYLEGCTAPMRDENQLHAAVVELVALDDAEIKYSTVQNWYPGDKEGRGGIYNFVTKRGGCRGKRSKISWTQVETGSAITWKYPSCILQGDDSVGEFYSVALTNNRQQADTGTKMIHIGKNTRSTIVSKGIAAGHGQQTYRGLVRIGPKARGRAQLLALRLAADRRPVRRAHLPVPRGEERRRATVEHEATTSKIGEDQLFYCRQRGLSEEDAVSMIVNGFCKEVLRELPDGVRRRGAEPARREPRRDVGWAMKRQRGCSRSDGPARRARGDAEILRGVDLVIRAGRGARRDGPERLGQEHARGRARRAGPASR